MSKKYYWPTLWDNLGNVLADGFIAPECVYRRLLPGDVFINLEKYSGTQSEILLFEEMPEVDINLGESFNADPVILEISEECLGLDWLRPLEGTAKVWSYSRPIFFDTTSISFIFYTSLAKERSLSRLSGVMDVKELDTYQKRFLVKDKPRKSRPLTLIHNLFEEQDSRAAADAMIKTIRTIDGTQGSVIGLLTGIFHKRTDNERDMIGLFQEIRNKQSGAFSDIAMSKDRASLYPESASENFVDLKDLVTRLIKDTKKIDFGKGGLKPFSEERLIELFIKLRLAKHAPSKLEDSYKKHKSMIIKSCGEDALVEDVAAYFYKNPLELKYAEELIQAPYALEIIKDLRNYVWNSEQTLDAKRDVMKEPVIISYRMKSLLGGSPSQVLSRDRDNEFYKLLDQMQELLREYFQNERVRTLADLDLNNLRIDCELGGQAEESENVRIAFMNKWLSEQQSGEYLTWQIIMGELIKETISRTKREIKNDGWQYGERIVFVNRVIDAVEQSALGEKGTVVDDLKIILLALKSNFEGEGKIEDIKSSILVNLFAFLFKFKDIEQLDRYLNQKQVSHSYYAWCFWGAFMGYSAFPKKYVDEVFRSLKKKEVDNIKVSMREIRQIFSR